MYGKIILLIVMITFFSLGSLPLIQAFSGSGNGYTMQGVLEYVGGRETASGYTVKFSGIDQPVGRANGTNSQLCLGEVCPTVPYIRLLGIYPGSPRTVHTLECGFNVTDTDIEESLIGNITWYMDNGTGYFPWQWDDELGISILKDTLTNTTTGDIDSSNTTKNQTWKCSMRVTDGFYWYEKNSSGVRVLNSPVIVHEVRTFLESLETSEFLTGETVITKVNVTDEDGRQDLDTVLINIQDTLLNNVVNNETMPNTTAITDGYQYEYSYLISATSPDGIWTINISANDTDNYIDTNHTTIIVFTRRATVQFILEINDTESTVFVPGVGEIDVNDIIGTEYTDPEDWYLTSTLGDILRALVFQERVPISLTINRTGFTHLLEINAEASNSKIYLVFTEGDQGDIDNRIDLVESGEFLSKITPTFGYGLGSKLPFKILLNYDDIDIGSNIEILQKGEHELELISQKSGSSKALQINKNFE